MSTGKLSFPTPLTEKYRPRSIDDFIGLQKPRKALDSFIEKPFDSAWMFSGASGIGKTSMALAIGGILEAEIHHIGSRQCDLETVESVVRMCHFAAFNWTTGKAAPWHVIICDEADQMTLAAQHCFLSKLDATARPPQTIFFFTANSTKAFEDRFLSRCFVVPFEYETMEGELETFLSRVYRKEGGKYPLSYVDICKAASYNVRDALNKLQLEILMGSDRSDLPAERDIKIVEAHTHNCKNCHKSWKHNDPLCELPFRHDCEQCGGAKTVGTARARKAWETIRRKIKDEVKEEARHKRKPAVIRKIVK